MKIALCLHGYFNNKADPNAGMEGYKYIKKHILDKYDTDVFIHSWEPDKSDLIGGLYTPKYAIFEEQKGLDSILNNYPLVKYENRLNNNFSRENSIFSNCKLYNTFSFFYSRYLSTKFMKTHLESNNIKYDWAIVCRFDLGQRDKHGNWKYYVSQMNFNPSLDNSFVYSAMWDQLNAGYADQWFYGNVENIVRIGRFFTELYNCFEPGSRYEFAVTEGWPDSRYYDNNSFTDFRQFTNEALRDRKSDDLMRYPLWQCINNHILYKWLFIESGLYKKSRFTDSKQNIDGFWEIK